MYKKLNLNSNLPPGPLGLKHDANLSVIERIKGDRCRGDCHYYIVASTSL